MGEDVDTSMAIGPLLAVVESRLRQAEADHRLLTDEIVLLKKAQDAIRRLQALREHGPVPAFAGKSDVVITSQDHPNPDLGGNWVITIHDAAPDRASKRRRSASPQAQGSTTRVTALLQEVERPLTAQELVEEFAGRGWLDPAWTRPVDAVAQAARRAVKQGWIRQLADKRFAADLTSCAALPDAADIVLVDRSVDAQGVRLIQVKTQNSTDPPIRPRVNPSVIDLGAIEGMDSAQVGVGPDVPDGRAS
jgi:hypothetical protein